MTTSRNRVPSTPSMDLTSTTIVLATSVFFLLGLAALTGSPTVAFFCAVGLGAAMTMSSKMLGLNSL
ncbi:hypothetical protein ACFQ9R_01040 [Nocardia sp. NPDC056541]|uniref:hypothetical protein n=1 Tax=Nocardia sp. NPDC056541 TaxID=3345860 RepID=UPI00366E13FD